MRVPIAFLIRRFEAFGLLVAVTTATLAGEALAIPFLGLKANGDIYQLSSDDNSELFLGSLSTPSTDFAGLTFSGKKDYYTFDRDLNQIIHFDPLTITVTNTVDIDRDVPVAPRGLDVDSNGDIYIASTGNIIYRLDPFTGITTSVVVVSGSAIEGLAFSDDDILFAVRGPGEFVNIDLGTGAANSFASFGFDGDSLAFGSDGFLYSAESGSFSSGDFRPFVRIDPESGTAVKLRSYEGGYNGLAELISPVLVPTAPVPEPTTLGLLCFGLLGMGFWRRRFAYSGRLIT